MKFKKRRSTRKFRKKKYFSIHVETWKHAEKRRNTSGHHTGRFTPKYVETLVSKFSMSDNFWTWLSYHRTILINGVLILKLLKFHFIKNIIDTKNSTFLKGKNKLVYKFYMTSQAVNCNIRKTRLTQTNLWKDLWSIWKNKISQNFKFHSN